MINEVIRIAEKASSQLLKIYDSGDFFIENKPDNSPLTIADSISNEIIINELNNFSSYPIITEETPISFEHRKNWSKFWLIDPLDGTKDFIAKNGQFTINIALIENSKPIFGVVFIPVTNDVYYAEFKKGAFKNGKKIYNSSRRKKLIATESNFHSTKSNAEFFTKFKIQNILKYGSSLKICKLAEGLVDVYPRLNGTKEWDTAASHIIANEAGCKLIDIISNEELVYNKKDFKNNFFVASRNDLKFDMKMIILAAGEGTRLRPLTENMPKCMVKFKGKPIIEYILEVACNSGITDVTIVDGYKSNVLQKHLKNKGVNFLTNEKYETTNMLSSLFCAKKIMNDDIIISYADIIYKKEILESLIASKDFFNVVIDKEWKKLWSLRMEDPLSDLETLKIKDNKIIELGKKTKSYDNIEGQYIGLIKISKKVIDKVVKYYDNLNKSLIYDGKDFNNMYMTSFIQMIIDNLMDVNPIFTRGGWIEIDSIEDLNAYNKTEIEF
jgi:3'(2'),5'-bisphosphate nucleotidase